MCERLCLQTSLPSPNVLCLTGRGSKKQNKTKTTTTINLYESIFNFSIRQLRVRRWLFCLVHTVAWTRVTPSSNVFSFIYLFIYLFILSASASVPNSEALLPRECRERQCTENKIMFKNRHNTNTNFNKKILSLKSLFRWQLYTRGTKRILCLRFL